MDRRYPPIFVQATADDFLAVLRDMHCQQCTHDPEANSDIALSHNTTIAAWREACELRPCSKVAQAMNAYWGVTIPMQQWREVLEPAKQRQSRGVCELL